MNKFLKLLLFALISWGAIFILTLFTAKDMAITERILYTLIYAVVGTFLFIIYTPRSKSKHSASTKAKTVTNSAEKSKTLYIYEGALGRTPVYRIERNKICRNLSQKFDYEIKGNKICYPLSTKWKYRIEGKYIYKGLEQKPIFRIDGDKIYHGSLGRTVAYTISELPYR